nr:hypothetical protein Itr_chr01CG06570 [Ipomoea trifida]
MRPSAPSCNGSSVTCNPSSPPMPILITSSRWRCVSEDTTRTSSLGPPRVLNVRVDPTHGTRSGRRGASGAVWKSSSVSPPSSPIATG